MKYPVFALRDEKVGFGSPRIALNEEVAKRDFGYEINRDGSPMAYAPADYALYQIGVYDTDNAKFESQLPEYIIRGTDVYGV